MLFKDLYPIWRQLIAVTVKKKKINQGRVFEIKIALTDQEQVYFLTMVVAKFLNSTKIL